MSHKSVLVWDEDSVPNDKEHLIILWRKFTSSESGFVSVPEVIETQAEKLRDRYLAFIGDISQKRHNNKRLVEILEFRKDFSYWWMTLLAEKCNWAKSPYIFDIISLFVLEDILESYPSEKLILVSANTKLALVVKRLCQKQKREFLWRDASQPNRKFRLLSLLGESTSTFIGGLHYGMQYIWERRALIGKRPVARDFEQKGILFVDYLINFNKSKFESGRYWSNYWTKLHDIFSFSRNSVNWLHLFIKHDGILTPCDADELVTRCNCSSTGNENHLLVDNWLSWTVIWRICGDYFRLLKHHLQLRRSVKEFFRPKGSSLDLWPLYKQDWINSFYGIAAIWNCIIYNLYESGLQQLPYQETGLYLQENQGWEIGFINAWRVAGHGRLIGVPHSTVRFWDLRYFHSQSVLSNRGPYRMPIPDYVAVNGPVSKQAYIDGQYPPEQLFEVEALRYLYLGEMQGSSHGEGPVLRVLICGDYLAETNVTLMQIISASASIWSMDFCLTLKPHPSCFINIDDYPAIRPTITHSPLGELLSHADVVITSNITSAAVDAYCANVPVISLRDGNCLNMHPLRGLEGVTFFSDARELSDILHNRLSISPRKGQPYFFLDHDLPRWRTLIGNIEKPSLYKCPSS